MTKRFTELERFLPPEPGGSRSDDRSRTTEQIRVRTPTSFRRWRRRASTVGAVLFAAALLVAGGIALGISPRRSSPATNLGVANDGVLEGGANPLVDLGRPDRSPDVAGRDGAKGKRAPRDSRRAGRAAGPPMTDVSVPVDHTARVRGKRVAREREEPSRQAKTAELPAPPTASLFRCESTKRSERFMTIDSARVGQMEEPGAGWECEAIGLVYAEEVANTVPIELDDGTAYVFKERGAKTDPECEKVALYRHWAGYDYWYATDQVDGGPVGYMRV